jgi:glutamate racemase
MDTRASIGIFDSGIGGLTVWNQLVSELPNESMLYVADSEHAPYGNKPSHYILDRSRTITRFLIGQGCKLVVVACNTATGAAISRLREEFNVPFVGVEPAIKPAASHTKTGHIGILATEQTFKGEHFTRSMGIFSRTVEVEVRVGAGLVELIESGKIRSDETRELLIRYLEPMLSKNIDQLVLGCTHYPFLIPLIRELIPDSVAIIDPAPAVAKQTRRVLEDNCGLTECSSPPSLTFFSTGDPAILAGAITVLSGINLPVGKLTGQPLSISGHPSLYQPA